MKKLLLGMAGIALLFGLILIGCENGVQEIKGTVNTNSNSNTNPEGIASPDVTIEALSGAVRLSWNMKENTFEATSYDIYRRVETSQTEEKLNSSPIQVESGYYEYYDIPDNSVGGNLLLPNTEYIYTVVASAKQNALLRDAKWTGSVRTTNLEGLFYYTGFVSGGLPDLPVSSNIIYTINASTTDALTGYYATIDLFDSSGLPIGWKKVTGAAYTVERAEVATNGTPGTWTDITSSLKTTKTDHSSGANVTFSGSLSLDGLNNVPDSVYDNSFTTATIGTGKTYLYRIKAVGNGQTEYTRESSVSFSPPNLFGASIDVGAASSVTNAKRFAITPTWGHYTNALQTGDKLVIYWVKSTDTNAFRYGYNESNKIEFTKADLEANTIASKNLDIPSPTGETGTWNVFIQVYAVSGGIKRDIEDSNITGGGISGSPGWYIHQNGEHISYAKLDY